MKKYLILLATLIYGFAISQPYSIGTRTITFTDPSRLGGFFGTTPRSIETRIYYPAIAPGANQTAINNQFPIVVIGHGFAMNSDAYQNLWEELVPRGYIVALPRTEASLIPFPSHNNFALDLAFVEQKMHDEGASSTSPFYQRVYPTSAIMGHSMGGGCTILATQNNNGSRLKTVVGFAPAVTDPSSITAALNVTVDALIFSGSSDGVTPPSDSHIPIYNNLNSTCKYFVNIIGGAHCYFANTNTNCDFGESTSSTGISVTRAQQQQITYTYLNPWLDFKLKGNCKAWDLFQDSLANSTRITFQSSCNYVVTPNPNVTPTGNIELCPNETITLNGISNANYNYKWFRNNTAISGATNDAYTVSQSGNYFLEITTDVFGCKDSSEVAVVIYGSEDTTFINSAICLGSSYSFPDGSSTQTPGVFHFALNSSINCDSVVSFTISIIEADDEITNITTCETDSFELPDGTFVNSPTTYRDTLVAISGCDSVYRTIHVGFETPIEILSVEGSAILNSNQNGNYFITSNIPYTHITWQIVGGNILNNTENSDTVLIEINSAIATLSVTAGNTNCSDDATFEIELEIINSLKEVTQQKLHVYPNPAQNNLTIDFTALNSYDLDINIVNIIGKSVYNGTISKQNNIINVSSLPAGFYSIISSKGSATFIKAN
jgi:dienelactone hydrolase